MLYLLIAYKIMLMSEIGESNFCNEWVNVPFVNYHKMHLCKLRNIVLSKAIKKVFR